MASQQWPRVSINEARNRQPEQLINVADLIDHYTETELVSIWEMKGIRTLRRLSTKSFSAGG